MSQCYIGEILLVPYLRGAPQGWLRCDGSILQISAYPTLFNLIGTTYGGDGSSTFGVPDLRGKVPVHAGQGGGLSNYTLGQTGGAEQVTLNTQQMPQHNHPMLATSSLGTTAAPSSGGALASMGPASTTQLKTYVAPGGTQINLAGDSVGAAGNSQQHSNVQPSQAMLYIICYDGVYPSQG